MQTSELGRKKTIISVDADEALAINWALEEYIERHRVIRDGNADAGRDNRPACGNGPEH
jgi:hypothetical protein